MITCSKCGSQQTYIKNITVVSADSNLIIGNVLHLYLGCRDCGKTTSLYVPMENTFESEISEKLKNIVNIHQ